MYQKIIASLADEIWGHYSTRSRFTLRSTAWVGERKEPNESLRYRTCDAAQLNLRDEGTHFDLRAILMI